MDFWMKLMCVDSITDQLMFIGSNPTAPGTNSRGPYPSPIQPSGLGLSADLDRREYRAMNRFCRHLPIIRPCFSASVFTHSCGQWYMKIITSHWKQEEPLSVLNYNQWIPQYSLQVSQMQSAVSQQHTNESIFYATEAHVYIYAVLYQANLSSTLTNDSPITQSTPRHL